MGRFELLLSVFLLKNISIGNCNIYMGTEKSLRDDIAKLMDGKLSFSDNNIPFYKEDLLDVTPKDQSKYDFIVIGAGSAGATIASRLSEIQNATVLLLEAGSKEYPIMDIPYVAPLLELSDEVNWNYNTEPSDKYCVGSENSRCNWPRGKVMGGSSVLNYMLATRGNKKDYDGWANDTGDESWSFKEMLKYFKKLENFEATDLEFDPNYHSKDGPVYISNPTYHPELKKVFMEAAKELGFPHADYNGKEQIGASWFQSTIKNGERWSTNRAYLHPAKTRKNLILSMNSLVNKILINKKKKKAYGVKFTKFGEHFKVKAKKEIILSAGSINSPQILMLSGIGPAKHLCELNIHVIKDLPVGENLMDHIGYPGLLFKVNDSETFKTFNLLDPKNSAIKDYLTDRKGVLSNIDPFGVLAYVNVDDPSTTNKNPNVELLQAINNPPLFAKKLISEKYRRKIVFDNSNHSVWSIMPMLMTPNSRGKILLKSKNPTDHPKLFPNYLSNPEDLRILIKGIRKAIEWSKTNAFQKLGSELYKVPLPCEKYEFDSDAYWECALRTFTMTIYHPSGTCKMGREDDSASVVNSKLQVIGIKSLRVADASVMPKIVSAHPNIPIIAIGEKLSDMVKRDWGYNDNSV